MGATNEVASQEHYTERKKVGDSCELCVAASQNKSSSEICQSSTPSVSEGEVPSEAAPSVLRCTACQRVFCTRHESPIEPHHCVACLPSLKDIEIAQAKPLIDANGVAHAGRLLVPIGKTFQVNAEVMRSPEMSDDTIRQLISEYKLLVHQAEITRDYGRVMITVGEAELDTRARARQRQRAAARACGAGAGMHVVGIDGSPVLSEAQRADRLASLTAAKQRREARNLNKLFELLAARGITPEALRAAKDKK